MRGTTSIMCQCLPCLASSLICTEVRSSFQSSVLVSLSHSSVHGSFGSITNQIRLCHWLCCSDICWTPQTSRRADLQTHWSTGFRSGIGRHQVHPSHQSMKESFPLARPVSCWPDLRVEWKLSAIQHLRFRLIDQTKEYFCPDLRSYLTLAARERSRRSWSDLVAHRNWKSALNPSISLVWKVVSFSTRIRRSVD